MIINVVTSSTKRHDELQAAQVTENQYMVDIKEIMTGKGANQIGTLNRPGDTRWGSHFRSICSVINMYEATCHVLKKLQKESKSWTTSGDADSSYNYLKEFDFVLILFMMKAIMGITDVLCQALQKQDQDVVNAMDLVRSTKLVIQDLRDDGWDELLSTVTSFCQRHEIEIPDLHDVHSTTRFGRSRLEENQNNYKTFKVETICTLVEKYYPMDFTEQEQLLLRYQLQHFIVDARQSSHLKNLSTIQELCSRLVETEKATIYFLIDRLLRLILTLPVSTATTERSFSTMKIIKNKLRNKMNSDFLADSMTVYIEREIAASIDSETIIDAFKAIGTRNASF
ncbi:unnamed protein product [Trifolium pratense]|uniref:Uncharacterized protein n=1 Tax=Trifolium pratense TaxID=57577 RepID=A0ACB0J1S9_TRIPR|nr:unnamed protein product [Trifolium pratense]